MSSKGTIIVTGIIIVTVLISLLLLSGYDKEPEKEYKKASDIFDLWESYRLALKESPDNLPARAEELIKKKDPIEIYKFVRDEIEVYPSTDRGLYDTSTMRWGVRGTLRGGAGTLREKSETLAYLYKKAGFKAEVVNIYSLPDKLNGKDLLSRTIKRKFAPNISEKAISASFNALGLSPVKERIIIDKDLNQTKILAKKMLDTVGRDRKSNFNFHLNEQVPIVRLMLDKKWTYANPFVVDGEFGQHYGTIKPTYGSHIRNNNKIKIRVDAVTNLDPDKPFTLIEKSWDPEDVVGRRIQLQFIPPGNMESFKGMLAEDITTWTPVLRVIGPSVDAETSLKLSSVGTTITQTGDRYTVTKEGQVNVNGLPLAEGYEDPAAVKQVSELQLVSIQTEAFPQVRLKIRAMDKSGNPVAGLPANSFQLDENDQVQSFNLLQNKIRPHRVLLLFDNTPSLPDFFRNNGKQNNITKFGVELIEKILNKSSGAQFRIAQMDDGLSYKGGWSSDLERLKKDLDKIVSDGTDGIWDSVSQAASEKIDIIMLFTDADPDGKLTDDLLKAIQLGAPVFAIGANVDKPFKKKNLEKIASISSGKSILIKNKNEAFTAILDYLGKIKRADYEFAYIAKLADKIEERNVDISIDNARISQKAVYETSIKNVSPQIAGLNLTISVGANSHTRTIAGIKPQKYALTDIKQHIYDEVRRTLGGQVLFSVEGPAPTLSVWLDEWYAEKMTQKSIWDALKKGDDAGIKQAIEEGYLNTPYELFLLNSGLPRVSGLEEVTFPNAPHIVTYLERPGKKGGIEKQFDIFSGNNWVTVSDDPKKAFKTTLTKTAYLSVLEGALSTISTPSLLKDKKLGVTPVFYMRNTRKFTKEANKRWSQLAWELSDFYKSLIHSADGQPVTGWLLNDKTGTVIGLLDDGSGGGTSVVELKAEQKRIETALDVIGRYGPGLAGVFASIEKAKVQAIFKAAIMIATMEAQTGWSDIGASLGCDMAKSAIGKVLPATKPILDFNADYGIVNNMMGGEGGAIKQLFPDSNC